MKIEWQVSEEDARRVRALVDSQSENPLVEVRRRRNLAESKPPVSRAQFWQAMVSMRLTSAQRSGPESHVARFIRSEPFPVAYKAAREAPDIERFLAERLRASGGIRFHGRIAHDLAANLERLEGGEWDRALQRCNELRQPAGPREERAVAAYIDAAFKGFGPKQSRNLLQVLGLTRYEIPVDSRITAWLNAFGFPVHINAAALQDTAYYDFVSDGIQALCSAAGVFPCLLDAAVFALQDGDGWTAENAVY